MFFCRFNDPIYVKLAKIDVLVSVADTSNVDIILAEFHEYCNDIDQDLVRRSIKAIGQVVCKVERVAKRGVEALKEHINHEGGSESALQEAVVVASKIFRKYPKKFEGLIKDICTHMKRIDEPESKSAFIWILGEFAEKIDNVEDMLQYFVESFSDETTHVCLQILTAAVKIYVKKSDECEEMVMNVLHLASEESNNPDLRDRGYIYWRMLSTDPTATKDVVLIKRPDYIESLGQLMDEETRELFSESVISKDASKSTPKGEVQEAKGDDEVVDDEEDDDDDVEEEVVEEKTKPKSKSKKKSKKDKKTKEKDKAKKDEKEEDGEEEIITTSKPKDDLEDIFGFGDENPEPVKAAEPIFDPLADIFGGMSDPAPAPAPATDSWANNLFSNTSGFNTDLPDVSQFIKPQQTEVLSSSTLGQSGKSGINMSGYFFRDGKSIKLQLDISNTTSNIASEFEILFNKNSFGVTAGAMNVIPISGGNSFSTTVD